MNKALKTCNRCLKSKPRSREFFYGNSANSDNLDTLCKDCCKARRQARKKIPKADQPHVKKLCNSCGIGKPLTSEYYFRDSGSSSGFVSKCKECSLKASKDFYKENEAARSKRIEYLKEYRKVNKATIKEKKRIYYLENQQSILENKAKFYAKNAESLRTTKQQYRQENPKKTKQALKRYYLKNRKKFSAYRDKRRAIERSALGSYTIADVKAKLELQGGLCYYCSTPLGESFHVDHKIPIAKGGTNFPANICAACASCNLSKSDKDFWEFLSFQHKTKAPAF